MSLLAAAVAAAIIAFEVVVPGRPRLEVQWSMPVVPTTVPPAAVARPPSSPLPALYDLEASVRRIAASTSRALPALPPKPVTTTTAATTTTLPTVPPDPPGIIASHWAQLYLDGRPYKFVTVDAPNAATWWGVNWGCGWQASDADFDALFSQLPAGTLVPFWATQAMAYNNKSTHAIDFTGIDRVFAAAQRNHVLLMPELETQQGYCSDGHWKDDSWYAGGYRKPYDDDGRGLEPLSYWDYVNLIVPRYADNPALGMWELMVEPEASVCDPGYAGSGCYGHTTCPSDAEASLQSFFGTVGAEVHRLDPHHLIADGTIGMNQCGTVGPEYAELAASPGIDVCEVHDYDGPSVPMNSQAQADIEACAQVGKPLIVGETGLNGAVDDGQGCPDLQARATDFERRVSDFLNAGASGVGLWDWGGPTSGCGYQIGPDDPVIAAMRKFDS